MSMIKTKKLTFEYIHRDEEGNVEGITKAVNEVDLDIKEGDFIAILGHNGSGKSTLAKHMNAILTPSEGAIYVAGMDTRDDDHIWDIRKNAGMVFQNPDNQIIGQVVEEDVGFGPENMGVPTKEIWQRVEESLKAVGMYAYRKHSPNKLSGGQKQRVAIARMLTQNSPVMIFDDSLSAVDAETDAKIRHELKEKMGSATIILISHRITTLMQADRILVLDNGRVAEIGTHEELIAKPGIYQEIYQIQMNNADRELLRSLSDGQPTESR